MMERLTNNISVRITNEGMLFFHEGDKRHIMALFNQDVDKLLSILLRRTTQTDLASFLDQLQKDLRETHDNAQDAIGNFRARLGL